MRRITKSSRLIHVCLISVLLTAIMLSSASVFAAKTCNVQPASGYVDEPLTIESARYVSGKSVLVEVIDAAGTTEISSVVDAGGTVSVEYTPSAEGAGEAKIYEIQNNNSRRLKTSCEFNAAYRPCGPGTWPSGCAFKADNEYDWEFVAPTTCDFTIAQSSDWDHINNPNYRIFCVHPGDYRDWNGGATLSLTANGTATEPRWILLRDPNNPADTTHPVHLPESQRAIMPQFEINNGDYWQIYRMTVKGYTGGGRMIGTRGTRWSHMLIEDGEKSGFPYVISDNGDYIFQYNVMRNIVPDPDRLDENGNVLQQGSDRGFFYIASCNPEPCIAVRNEIINPASFHFQIAPPEYQGGLRIDENEMYMSDAARTDCDTGLPDPAGACASNEQVIVFKAPTAAPAEPSYVTNNVIHHSYYFDGKSCCSSSASWAAAINVGSGTAGTNKYVSNVIIENNVIFEASQGIVFQSGELAGQPNGAHKNTVRRNLLYHIQSAISTDNVALRTHPGYDHLETHNLVVDGEEYLSTTAYLGWRKTHQCNVVIDGGIVWDYSVDGWWSNNHAFGNTEINPTGLTGYADRGDPANAAHGDLCVTTQFITGPATYCIPNGKVTAASPHFSCAVQ